MPDGLETLVPSERGMSDFKECLKHLRDGQHDEAFTEIRRALRTAPGNPFYVSYAGLLAALAEQRFFDAERLCLEALRLRHNHPQLYINLAKVYQTAGRFQEAIAVLEKGLISTGRDPRLRMALKTLGCRRQPVFPFVDRSNAMNRVLGKWRHRLLGPMRAV